MQALAAARETLYQQDRAKEPEGDPPTMVQQPADALALLAETALHHGIDPGTPGERYQVVVHVDAPVLAESDALADPAASGESLLEAGAHVSAETSRRLTCDATWVVMRHDADGSARGRGQFRRRFGARCSIETEVAGSPHVDARLARRASRRRLCDRRPASAGSDRALGTPAPGRSRRAIRTSPSLVVAP